MIWLRKRNRSMDVATGVLAVCSNVLIKACFYLRMDKIPKLRGILYNRYISRYKKFRGFNKNGWEKSFAEKKVSRL